MQCRLLRGLVGALLILLGTWLLTLRYRSDLSPQEGRETLRLSAPSSGTSDLQLRDVFIAVKTTQAFHRSRLELLLDTWVSRTRQQVKDGQLWEWSLAVGIHRARSSRSSGLGSPAAVPFAGATGAQICSRQEHIKAALSPLSFATQARSQSRAFSSLLGSLSSLAGTVGIPLLPVRQRVEGAMVATGPLGWRPQPGSASNVLSGPSCPCP